MSNVVNFTKKTNLDECQISNTYKDIRLPYDKYSRTYNSSNIPYNKIEKNDNLSYNVNKNKEHIYGDDIMNNDLFIEKYIEKMDRDQSELKNDIRESEKRTYENQKNMEDRIEKMINLSILSTEKQIKHLSENLSNKIDNTEKQIDKLSTQLYNTEKNVQNMSITVTIGVASMVLAAIGFIYSILRG